MRSFIAVAIPEDVRSSIKKIINDVSTRSKAIRWVPVENIHLTLKFLGEVKEELVPQLEKSLRTVCSGHKSFKLGVRGAGAFPSLRSPNVLWIGLDKSNELGSLFDGIESSLADLGFEKEGRAFSPHLTIGRVKDRRDIEPVMKSLSTYKDSVFGTIDVREVLLMKSVLKPSGAEYSKVAVFNLDKA